MRQQIKFKMKWTSVLYALLIVLPVAGIIFLCDLNEQKQYTVDNIRHLAQDEAGKLKYAIESRLMSAEILKILVVNNRGKIDNFDETARWLYTSEQALRSVQLAPDGVVSYIYPLARNEEGFLDLFQDPERKGEAERARDTGKMTLAGPYELAQGGMGIVARNPVYLTDENGRETFWGFSIVVLNVPEIFGVTELNYLSEENYYYHIWKMTPENDEVQTIYTNTAGEFDETVQADIRLPNTVWHLSICPKDGWIAKPFLIRQLLVFAVCVLIMTALLSVGFSLIRQRNELIVLLNTDPLTGAYNARFFSDKLNELSVKQTPFALFYLDINNFKQINNKYGHTEGDQVLREIASRIRQSIGKDDIFVRMGGDVFVVLTPSCESEDLCKEIKNRLRRQISAPYEFFDQTFVPDVSIGYARYPADASEVKKVVWLADTRMYGEKQKG